MQFYRVAKALFVRTLKALLYYAIMTVLHCIICFIGLLVKVAPCYICFSLLIVRAIFVPDNLLCNCSIAWIFFIIFCTCGNETTLIVDQMIHTCKATVSFIVKTDKFDIMYSTSKWMLIFMIERWCCLILNIVETEKWTVILH